MVTDARCAALKSLAESTLSLFPEGATFHVAPGAYRNFFVIWPLRDQPVGHVQHSRPFSVYFDDSFLTFYEGLEDGFRSPYKTLLRGIVSGNLSEYDDGRHAKVGVIRNEFLLETSGVLVMP
ncbi:hypothetical protein PPN31119_03164 [Pandoraea pnomenusa]|uniref:Uncharacterized protein n=1 Tax=Pandoraea pnomenusa TaxID=93220 RepID=A0ABY6WM34_9BURK|nr:hypothetical protein PPN31119_03164 [Pandoraea pnomenusa]